MAWQDRDYHREPPASATGRLSMASMTAWLLAINIVVFILDSVLLGSARASVLAPLNWGNFNIRQGILGLQVWRWFTYQFVHGGLLHVLFNMLALYFFGPLLERWWGARRFLAFYLFCGASGAFVYTGLSYIPGLLAIGPTSMLVGASGSIFGILVGAAVLFPHQRVMLLFPPIPMTMRVMALIFLGLAVLSVLVGAVNSAGEAAHLGGAALGFLLVKQPWLLNWADWRWRRMHLHWSQNRWRKAQEKVERKEAALDAEVDRILAKVKDHGLPSLTGGEKRTLQKATERQRHAG